MADINDYLKKILSAVYGKDVRQAIRDAIYQCYEDGKSGAIDLIARERIDNLVSQSGSTEGNSELTDIRVGADGKTYATAGTAVREQIGKITDELASMPDDILNVHVWEKFSSSKVTGYEQSSELIVFKVISVQGSVAETTIEYSDSVGNLNGSVTVAEPLSTITFNSKNNTPSDLNIISGKFAMVDGVCYKIRDNTEFAYTTMKIDGHDYNVLKCSAEKVKCVEYSESYGYISSSKKDAYPTVGYSNGYNYEYKGTLGQSISKIEAMK